MRCFHLLLGVTLSLLLSACGGDCDPADSASASGSSSSSSSSGSSGSSTPTGLTLMFTPTSDMSTTGGNIQHLWYCASLSPTAPCYINYTDSLTTVTFLANQVNNVQTVNIPLSTLTSQNATTGTFSVTVQAPADPTLLVGLKIGPGVGITCTQRVEAPRVGTVNGNLSGDWTGAGSLNGVPQRNYWYAGCSLNSGVTYAEFYGILQ